MPDATRAIDIIFRGDSASLVSSLEQVNKQVQATLKNAETFGDNLQQATQPVADFTTAAIKIEGALLAAGAAVAAFSIKVASDMQSALAGLNKVLGDTDNLEEYKQLAIDLSEVYGQSAVAIVEAMTTYKQAGFTAQEAAALTKAGLDLMIAGDLDAVRASELLVSTLKGFDVQAANSAEFANELAKIIDLLNAVSNNYATDVNQLATGLATLAPVAKAAGFSIQETISILTPGIEVYRSGAEVATAFRTVLAQLVSDSGPVQEALAKLGVSQEDANGNFRAARDIYYDVAAALKDYDANQKIALASQLVGIDQSGKFLAVIEKLGVSLEISSDRFKYAGSAAAEVAIQLETAEKAADRARVAFSNMFGAIGDQFLDEFTGISDALTRIFQALRDSAVSDTGLGQLVELVKAQLGELENLLSTVATNLPAALGKADFSGFADGIGVLGDAIAGLLDGFDLSTSDGLAKAITALGEGFEILSTYVAGAVEAFGPFVSAIAAVADIILQINPQVVIAFGAFGGIVTVVNAAAGAFNYLIGPTKALAALLAGPAGLAALVAAVSVGFVELANKITELATGNTLITWIIDIAGKLGLWNDEAERIVQRLNDTSAAASSTGTALESLATSTGKAGNATREAGEATKEGLAALQETSGIAEEYARVMADLEAAANDAAGAQTGVASAIDEANRSWIEGADGVRIYADSLNESAQAAQDSGRSWIEGADGVRIYTDGLNELRPSLEDSTRSWIEWSDGTRVYIDSANDAANASDKVADGLDKTAESAKKASEAAQKTALELEKLASNERIANIEASVTLQTAQLEADAQKAVAIIDALAESISSTAGLLGDLYGELNDADNFRDRFLIEDQIKLENERREKELQRLQKLTDAQIKLMQAQAAALQDGQAFITIDGAGLQPHLEAFMFEILEAVQVKTNSEGLALLLGVS